MVFVDILTSQLFVLGFAGLVISYLVLRGYMSSRRGTRNSNDLKSGVAPIALLGLYMFISGIWGQFAWPLPGSYNILFYDLYTLAGLLVISFAWSLYNDGDLRSTGVFGLLLGLVTIYYGYVGYSLNMTQSPIALLGLYFLFGIAGVLGCPLTLLLNNMRAGIKSKGGVWPALVAVFLIVLVLGSLLSIFIAGSAIPVHLATPP